MRNGIIISVLLIIYILQLTKYEQKDVRESIDSENTNLSSIRFAE